MFVYQRVNLQFPIFPMVFPMVFPPHPPSRVQGAQPRHPLRLHAAEELREDVAALLVGAEKEKTPTRYDIPVCMYISI